MTKFAMILSAIGAATLPLAMPAVVAPVEPAAAASQGDAAPASTARTAQRYCSVNRATGSFVSRKICKTRDEWMAQQGVDPRTVR